MDRKGTVMELDEILNAEPEFRYRMLSRNIILGMADVPLITFGRSMKQSRSNI